MLAQSTINTIAKFSESELLFHFHHRNALAVKQTEKDKVVTEFYDQVK